MKRWLDMVVRRWSQSASQVMTLQHNWNMIIAGPPSWLHMWWLLTLVCHSLVYGHISETKQDNTHTYNRILLGSWHWWFCCHTKELPPDAPPPPQGGTHVSNTKYLQMLIKEGKGAYSSSWNSPQNYETPLVICHPTEVTAPPSPQPGRLVLDLSTP